MAAFTTFSEQALSQYLVMFGKGSLKSFSPIDGGIENSNYFVTLDDETEYVLTIIEGHEFEDLSFFYKVTSRLFQYGLPVPASLMTLDGMTTTIFCGKPAVLVPKLSGSHINTPDSNHCFRIGEYLAQSHEALRGLKVQRANPYHQNWMRNSLERFTQRLQKEEQALLETLLDQYKSLQELKLPRGIIHGDLFVDNALFSPDGELTGVIDFYHACDDFLIQDVAIALNDWCRKAGQIDPSLRSALIDGYNKVRQLTLVEQDNLALMQKISAARFALTRFESGEPPLKDPQEMIRLAATL